MPGPICPDCGMDAVVTVVSGTGGRGRELRQFCRECERRRAERERDQLRPLAQSLARLLVYGGFLVALLTAAADHLAISGRPGFGWRQITGMDLGLITIILGIALRKGLLLAAGALLLALSIGADPLAVGHAPGVGWREVAGFVSAAVMVFAGTAWRRALAEGKGPFPHRRAHRPTES